MAGQRVKRRTRVKRNRTIHTSRRLTTPRSRATKRFGIIGVDPSSRSIAFMILHPDGSHEAHKIVVAMKGEYGGSPLVCRRAFHEVEALMATITADNPTVRFKLFIEMPLMGRGGFTASAKQAFVNGVIQAASTPYVVSTELVNVSSWKKRVVGRGNASKQEVSRHLRSVRRDLSNACGKDQDLVDAACIALDGSARCGS